MSKRYYLVYLLPSLVESVPTAEEFDDCLYAYTDDKEVIMNFRSFRNLSSFRIEKKELEKNDICYLAKEHQDKILRLRELKTSSDRVHIEHILISVTDREMHFATADIRYKMCNKYPLDFDPCVFTDEILISISRLGGFRFDGYKLPFIKSYDDKEMMLEEMCKKISSSSEMEIDELDGFIKAFYMLMKVRIK